MIGFGQCQKNRFAPQSKVSMNQQKNVADDKSMVDLRTLPGQKTKVAEIIPGIGNILEEQAKFLAAKPLPRRERSFPHRLKAVPLERIAVGYHRDGRDLMLRRKLAQFAGDQRAGAVFTVAVGQKRNVHE